MPDFTIKRGDTRPALELTLKRGTNIVGLASTAATPFTASLVKLIAKHETAPIGFTGTMTIASAAGGFCRYVWQSTDTASSGNYNAEAQVTWNDGGVETFPESGYLSLDFTQDLGD